MYNIFDRYKIVSIPIQVSLYTSFSHHHYSISTDRCLGKVGSGWSQPVVCKRSGQLWGLCTQKTISTGQCLASVVRWLLCWNFFFGAKIKHSTSDPPFKPSENRKYWFIIYGHEGHMVPARGCGYLLTCLWLYLWYINGFLARQKELCCVGQSPCCPCDNVMLGSLRLKILWFLKGSSVS